MNESTQDGKSLHWMPGSTRLIAFIGFGGLLAVVAWIWRVANPIGATDLSVLIRNEVFIELPALVETIPLSLAYGESQFRSALIFEAAIVNTGSRPIVGTDSGGMWRLVLHHPDGLPLLQLSPIVREPPRIADTVLVRTIDNSVEVEIGLLNQDDEVRLGLIALEHPNEFRLPLTAVPSPIPDLGRVAVERGSARIAVHSRIRDRIFIPILVLTFIGLLANGAWTNRKASATQLAKWSVPFVLASAVAAAVVSFGISWALAWLGVLANAAS